MKFAAAFRPSHLSAGLLALALAVAAHAADPIDPSLKEFVEKFKGKGALNDGSKPLTPEETIQHFKVADGFEMQVVAHEPVISQPLNLHFDERGRLWVVQYLQYPFPAGLKVIKYDQYLRAVFDKVPEPPPRGVKGLDKITILEDTHGNGVFDKAKDFVTGLNICTSVVTGHGGVWVLNPPYLLFYPDRNHDDIPDSDPEVRLSGFGLEDTHAVASSLHWGPDGWLYGAQGSTTTATINGIHFLGQAIWRYHPDTHAFEVFAEGGGNTFSLDFDSQGRAFSGTNAGDTRGLHYEQGGAYIKNWAKHGPLMDPYSFGWFEHMANKGFKPRFAQSLVIYEGGALPGFEGQIIASMSLVNRVQASKLINDTSTYRTEDTVTLVNTDDRWFRPVDTKTGPDGAVYLADWYDSRLTHVDPRDTWDHDHGRVYRLQAKGAKPIAPFDLGKASNDELIKTLSHPNKWFREMALRILADRHDTTLVPRLQQIVNTDHGQLALEAFWAVNLSGGFDNAFALKQLKHPNPSVRSWTVRLLGDSRQLAPALEQPIIDLARTELDPQVRAQLASSAKRWPAEASFPIIRELLLRSEDVNDLHIPLLLWWALENKATSDRAKVIALLKESPLWQTPIFHQYFISRLGQRFTADRSDENLATAAELLTLSPGPAETDLLVTGMEAGLRGDLVKSVPPVMQQKVADVWAARPHTPTLISFATRLGYEAAAEAAIEKVSDAQAPAADRKKFLALLAERRVESAVPVFLNLLRTEKSESLRLELLNALQRFTDGRIAQTTLELYPTLTPKLRDSAITILTSRPEWARLVLAAVDGGTLKKEQVTVASLMKVQSFNDAQCDALIKKHWGKLRQSSEEKEQKIAAVRKLVTSGHGDPAAGRELFRTICAVCHTLNGEGAKVGPELTGYERDNLDFMIPAIVDPSLGIREEYTAFNVTTKDDQALTGFILENTPQSVTLMDVGQNKVVIPREQIKSLAASPISLMPEGLLDVLNDQQIRDLFSYVTKR